MLNKQNLAPPPSNLTGLVSLDATSWFCDIFLKDGNLGEVKLVSKPNFPLSSKIRVV